MEPEQAALNFISNAETITDVVAYGHGIIHDTYLVKLNSGVKQFILQRVNSQVFKYPAANMHNLRLVSEHIRKRTKADNSRNAANWQMLQVIKAGDGRDFSVDAAGGFWRALSFIRAAVSLEHISSLADAGEAGRALGTFHRLLSDLNHELLHDTLPGFHNVESYLKHYDAVGAQAKGVKGADGFCRQFIEDRRNWAPVLEKGRRKKFLTVRVIHGDPKINNIMLDEITGKAVSMIDLDTVMPGLLQYDVGDCLRSCCNTMGEEPADLSSVRFDLERCKALLYGYTKAAQTFLTEADFDYLFDATRLMPFELGLRFYTDYLEGNVYFKTNRRNQNLERAMVQFTLVEKVEQQEEMIRAIIKECRAAHLNSVLQ